jgi:hypothetical protein
MRKESHARVFNFAADPSASFSVIENEEDQKGGCKGDQHEEPCPMNHPLFIFSGDHTEPFSPGVAQNDDEETEKKKESHIEREVLHRYIP